MWTVTDLVDREARRRAAEYGIVATVLSLGIAVTLGLLSGGSRTR
jgi:Flp pilus assembly pilin Flp